MDHRKNTQMGYHPDYLTTNFYEQRCQKSHKKRLKSMKPYIDSRTNKVMDMPHLKSRLKKAMNDKHKRDRIQHENRMLLNRLSHVMRTKQVDDEHPKEFTSDVHRKTLAIKRQFKWNKIARENERMGRRIANAKSAYSRKDLKKKRRKAQATPAANSRLVMPWTLHKGVGRVQRTAQWGQEKKKRGGKARSRSTGGRLMPSLTSGFEAAPRSAQAPFMTMDTMASTMPRLRTSQSLDSVYNNTLKSATTSRSSRDLARSESSGAMAAWEEIKSWSLWDMPLEPRKSIRDMDLRMTRPAPGSTAVQATRASLETTLSPLSPAAKQATGGAAAGEVAYGKHDRFAMKPRGVAKPLTGSGARFIGGDVQLLRVTRTLNDGAKWQLRAVEVGHSTHLQDDVMAGFRVDATQVGGGPTLDIELTVDDVKELGANWDDRIVTSTLNKCKVIPKTGGRLFQRFTSMKVTDIGNRVTAQQWEEESNRQRYLRRRIGKFLLDRVVVKMQDDLLALDMDWADDDEDGPDRVTWTSMASGAGGKTASDEEGEEEDGGDMDTAGEAAGASAGDAPYANDADSFVVQASLMLANTGAPVQGATVTVRTVGGEVVTQGMSDERGNAMLRCHFTAWRDAAMEVVATMDDGTVVGETGLLWPEEGAEVHATLLVTPTE